MQLVQLIIPAEAAHDTVYQLGEVRSPCVAVRARALSHCGAHRSCCIRPCETSAATTPGRFAPRPATVAQPAFAARLKRWANAERTCQRADSRALFLRTPQAGVMQFKDLNADKSAFQRTYANQARALCSHAPCRCLAHTLPATGEALRRDAAQAALLQ